MSITFKSAGHALASVLKKIVADAPKVAADVQKDIKAVEGKETIIETATTAILGAVAPGAALPATSIESAAFAVLGEVSALISAGGSAAEAKLLNAGLDQSVVSAAKAVAASAVQVGALVSATK